MPACRRILLCTTPMRRASLALVSFVLVSLVLACGCSDSPEPAPEVPAIAYCDDARAWEGAHAAFEREVVELVNERRLEGADCVSGGEFYTPSDPLVMDPALRCAARMHTLAMIAGDYFETQSPDGETYVDRVEQAEYDGSPLAQSIAAGQSTPESVVATLMSNDGNCANLMDPEATQIGVGYRPASDVGYSHYWTLVFGN